MILINQSVALLNTLRDQLTTVLAVNGIDVLQLLPKSQEPEPASKPSSQLDEKRPRKK